MVTMSESVVRRTDDERLAEGEHGRGVAGFEHGKHCAALLGVLADGGDHGHLHADQHGPLPLALAAGPERQAQGSAHPLFVLLGLAALAAVARWLHDPFAQLHVQVARFAGKVLVPGAPSLVHRGCRHVEEGI